MSSIAEQLIEMGFDASKAAEAAKVCYRDQANPWNECPVPAWIAFWEPALAIVAYAQVCNPIIATEPLFA